jgi:hypothetical protein
VVRRRTLRLRYYCRSAGGSVLDPGAWIRGVWHEEGYAARRVEICQGSLPALQPTAHLWCGTPSRRGKQIYVAFSTNLVFPMKVVRLNKYMHIWHCGIRAQDKPANTRWYIRIGKRAMMPLSKEPFLCVSRKSAVVVWLHIAHENWRKVFSMDPHDTADRRNLFIN